jgi:hypothetical protein
MNFLDIRAGEPIEVGIQPGFRFWRYALPRSAYDKVGLFSFVADRRWYPDEAFEARSPGGGLSNPDVEEQGVHAFKSMEDLMWSIHNDPARLVGRAKLSGCDGIVIGTVALWGVTWEHMRGYRAQYARPLSFTSSYGRGDTEALSELRAMFSGRVRARSE